MRFALLTGVLALQSIASATAGFIIQQPGPQPFPAVADRPSELDQAVKAFDEGRLEECEELLTRARSTTAELPSVGLMMARLFLASGQTTEAQRRLDELAATDPDDAEVYASLGELALLAGRTTDAWLQYEKAAATSVPAAWSKPRQLNFRRELTLKRAELAERRRDWSSAERLYTDWLNEEEEELSALLGLSRSLILQDRIEAAFPHQAKARTLDPEVPEPALFVALVLDQHHRETDADAWFRKATEAVDASSAARLEYARSLLLRGEWNAALDQLRTIPEGDEEDRQRRYLLGLALRAAGDLTEAEGLFAALHQSAVTDWEAANQLALVLIESPDELRRARALQIAETNARQFPNSATTVATLGWVNLRLGAIDRAEELLGRAGAAAAADPQIAYYVAELLRLRGRETDATALLARTATMRGFLPQRVLVDQTSADTTAPP